MKYVQALLFILLISFGYASYGLDSRALPTYFLSNSLRPVYYFDTTIPLLQLMKSTHPQLFHTTLAKNTKISSYAIKQLSEPTLLPPPLLQANNVASDKVIIFVPVLQLLQNSSYIYNIQPILHSSIGGKTAPDIQPLNTNKSKSPFLVSLAANASSPSILNTVRVAILIKISQLNHFVRKMLFLQEKPAQTKPKSEEIESAFENSTPPAGFDDIIEEETNAVDVYYGDLALGQFMATYTNDYITFQEPSAIVKKIPFLKDAGPVTQALTGQLKTHAEKLCTKKDAAATPENTCGFIEPETAGVIFDWGRFQAKIFINPQYVKDVERSLQFLPDSTGGYGYLTSFQGVATQSISEGNTVKQFTYSNNSVIGYKENNLTANSIYTSGGEEDGQGGYIKIVRATFNRDIRGKLYQAGILDLPSNNILPSDEILGFSLSNSRNTIMNLDEFQAAPLILYLNTMSNVQVYRNDQLIWSKVLPMGKQIIDTSGFPGGSYMLQIKITDFNGQVQQTQQFFSKNTAFPSPDFPDFNISAGIRKNYVNNAPRDLFYKYDQQKIFNISYAKGLKYPYGFRINGLFIDAVRSYLESGLFYLAGKLNISSGLLLSNQKDYGFYSNGSYNKENFSNSIYLRKMWATQSAQPEPNEYDPVAGSLLNLSDSLSYTYGKNNFSASISFSQAASSEKTTSFSLSWTRPLLSRHNFMLNGGISATHSTETNSLLFQLSCAFPQNKFRPSFSQAYKQQKAGGETIQGSTTSGNMRYQTQTENYHAGFSFSGTKDIDSNSLLASGSYDTHYLATDLQASYMKPQEASATQTYSFNFGSNLAYNPGGYGVSSRGLPLSGIIIKVKDSSNGKYKALINGSPNQIINSNSGQAIFLPPYATYNINVVSADKQKNIGIESQSPSTTVTLYPGNIQVLAWEAHPKSILVAQALDQKHQPMVGFNVTGGASTDTTAEEGFFQIDIFDITKELTLTDNVGKPVCKIQLPTFNISEDYIFLKELICKPI